MLAASSDIKTVSQLTAQLRRLLETEYRFIHVNGEISNLRTPYSGHSYFILKDSAAQLRCVLFKNQKRYLDQPLADGQKITCHGRISVYEPRGEYQLIIDTVDHDGVGSLQAEFERLKKKLNDEGLFSPEKKADIPAQVQQVVVVTSPSGAALQDFLKVHQQSKSGCSITIYPVSVQGANSAPEIIRALQYINQLQPVPDCIVICRGGGSLEDLWCFNDEMLAREIAASTVPVISAIGHEIDFTIADFCADKRCPTPTAAASFLFDDTLSTLSQLASLRKRLIYSIQTRIASYQQRLHYHSRVVEELQFLLDKTTLRLDYLTARLHSTIKNRLQQEDQRVKKLHEKILSGSPARKLQYADQQLAHLVDKMQTVILHLVEKKQGQLANAASTLDAVSPLATMSRGYAAVYHKQKNRKKIVTDSSRLRKDDRLEISLYRGKIGCVVEEIIE